jgi:hypothetical protein
MKKVILLFIPLIALSLTSCNLDGENYVRYYDFVSIQETNVPAHAVLGDTVSIFSRAAAPNGCWSELQFQMLEYNDSVFLIRATGLYESYEGICPEILVTKDSIFGFIPDTTGTFVFISQSPYRADRFDTLVVTLPLLP